MQASSLTLSCSIFLLSTSFVCHSFKPAFLLKSVRVVLAWDNVSLTNLCFITSQIYLLLAILNKMLILKQSVLRNLMPLSKKPIWRLQSPYRFPLASLTLLAIFYGRGNIGLACTGTKSTSDKTTFNSHCSGLSTLNHWPKTIG